ncbi:Ctr copper transporter [Sodiomyces alkalinus F11]|uniref:Copper transport protein n=1 Tax=Sodiomyces alkalinus (strain CBS 110278 / VKM F-3762 / F11) TaxID=1314773 RepID=A0A3N2Q564_SODAK|nr:Ctr copper transporter [Sodiomyces alkalinus F11]ROT41765.1 Ctr copper transporter [Sodiomyces alkalinus F11]
MLWNWNTIDSCFIARSWRITSAGMFAGSCIGVILLVMCLELLRRSGKEYDRYLIRSHAAKYAAARPGSPGADDGGKVSSAEGGRPVSCAMQPVPGFRPSVMQQAIRALLHMLQFAVAYFVMLLAMYYNGYFIICIFIGAYLGSLFFHWETMGGSTGQTSVSENPTVCCG